MLRKFVKVAVWVAEAVEEGLIDAVVLAVEVFVGKGVFVGAGVLVGRALTLGEPLLVSVGATVGL